MTFLTKYDKPKENTHQSCRLLYRIFICFFFLLEYIDTVPFFSLESPELYDTGKCTEFDRKLLNSFIMNDVI